MGDSELLSGKWRVEREKILTTETQRTQRRTGEKVITGHVAPVITRSDFYLRAQSST
jgi:hypothetical protein